MMVEKKAVWMQRRKRVFELVEVTISDGWLNRVYGIVSTLVLLVNLAATIMYTFDYMELHYGGALRMIEAVTVAFFALDFALRVWTAPCKYPGVPERQAVRKYVLSFTGMIDLLSFLPYYLPIFFPAGAVVFRMFRVIRISRQTIIVMVKRNGTMLVPRGDLMLLEGDHVILYSQGRIPGAEEIHF